MKSENWEQLWREQAVPPSAVNLDRFHAELRSEPEAWEKELDDNQRFMIRLILFNVLLSLPSVFLGAIRWGGWRAC
jgi:hypothetical protein